MQSNPNDHAPPDLIGQLSGELSAARAVLGEMVAAHGRWRGTGEAGEMVAADRALGDAARRAERLLAAPGSAEQWIDRHVEP